MMNREMNTHVTVVIPVSMKSRLIDMAEERTIYEIRHVTVSELIRRSIEKLIRDAESKEEEN